MPSTTASRSKKLTFGDINITPLTDVFLVLLVIVMVVAPVGVQVHSPIRPPEISAVNPAENDACLVEITREGSYIVEGSEVTLDDLSVTLRDGVAQRALRKASIRADRFAESRVVIGALQAAERAGVEEVTVVGEAQTLAQGGEAHPE